MAAGIALAGGCHDGASPGADHDLDDTPPEQPCSELAGAVHGWLGGAATCARGPDMRELLAIGDGYVLDWTPRTLESRVWKVGEELPLGAAPITGGPAHGILPHSVFFAIGKRRILILQNDRPDASIFTVNVLAPAGTDALMSTLGEDTLETSVAGRAVVGLDDGLFLNYQTGTGAFNVQRLDDTPDAQAGLIETTDFRGVNDAFRRGARLSNLGDHRLLEWVPATHHYRVWSYGARPEPADFFDPLPVAEGDLPDLTPDHEIVPVTPHRVLVWERSTGHTVLRALDPRAANPLGGAIVGESTYPRLKSPDWPTPMSSAIENLVLVLQDGRSFDSYFGRYCQAPPGSDPSCRKGPACCEGMPTSVPGAASCSPLDATVDGHVPKSDFACMVIKVGVGAQAGGFTLPSCGAPADFACALTGDAAGPIAYYHRAAATGSIADRFFQSTLDGTEPNLIYLTKAAYGSDLVTEFGLQLTRLMAEARVRWALYQDDAGDTRGHYPPTFFDTHWDFFRGVSELGRDVELEQLPAISVVLAGPSSREQPGGGPAEVGIRMVETLADQIARSPRYAPTTLVLLTYLTSGGFFDHVVPPPPVPSSVDTRDGMPVAYGPRVPLLALGPFARRNGVSHVQMELSSITKFIEWNWLGGETGQIHHRDATVANIGSLLDRDATRVPVPE